MKELALVESFRAFVKREALFDKEDRLLLACSGGIDSTTLAHLLYREDYDFALAHCNFQLRGEESDADAKFVADLAKSLKVTLHTTSFATKSEVKSGESTQMTARRLRYKYFKKILDEYKYEQLLTAHQLEDSFETMLLNLVRGTGLKGLTGIPVRNDRTVRPLLGSSRREIAEYAHHYGIAWREDRSNSTDDYLRNRIRHELLPSFFAATNLTPGGLAATIDYLRSDYRFYLRGMEAVAQDNIEYADEGDTLIVHDLLSSLPFTDALSVLRHYTRQYGFTNEQYRQLLEADRHLLLSTPDGFAKASPGRIVFTKRLAADSFAPLRITQLPYRANTAHWTISIDEVTRPAKLEADNTQYLRPTPLELNLRPRQNGDRFKPLGMQGRQMKVKDYLINEKIPPWEKGRIPLLCDAAGHIMALCGHRIAEDFKVRPEDETVLRVRMLYSGIRSGFSKS